MFYLQGKAYHAGYLVYFHLDNTQMSISTSDAMWLTYRAWGNGAAHILLTSGDWFLDMLMSILLPATIGCVVLILLLVIEKLRRKAAKPRVSATAIPFKDQPAAPLPISRPGLLAMSSRSPVRSS